ncbi:Rho GTPase activation protein [Phycomyces nitens]|nr:Rho GTPase activation protein [Phycomyces nitens]
MELMQHKDTSLKNWWKKVTLKKQNTRKSGQVFGVPLENSLDLSRASVSFADVNKTTTGYVPTIVAKCGFFLKDQGLYTEGVFRMSGSAKRIGELQLIFNAPIDYGKQFDWKGYSVHDAANVLRRFLNYMPEPVIVHELYQPFRDVMETESTDINRIRAFQHLLEQLPCENQHLLFYLLDLIGVFGKHAHYTKMDIFNLASVFTPGLLLSPEHAMNPIHYKTSQKVVQFLIEHRGSFKMPKHSGTETVGLQDSAGSDRPCALESLYPDLHSGNLQIIHSSPYGNSPATPSFNPNDLGFPSDEKHLLRANTVPAKRSRYGFHDPIQTIHMNKGNM